MNTYSKDLWMRIQAVYDSASKEERNTSVYYKITFCVKFVNFSFLFWKCKMSKSVRLRAPFLAMVKWKQAFLCSSGLTKTFFFSKSAFSRHGKTKASFPLLIWLNENVPFLKGVFPCYGKAKASLLISFTKRYVCIVTFSRTSYMSMRQLGVFLRHFTKLWHFSKH